MGLSVTAGSRYAQTRDAALWSAARRAQVMNPEKLRDVYGSLIYLLQVPAGSSAASMVSATSGRTGSTAARSLPMKA